MTRPPAGRRKVSRAVAVIAPPGSPILTAEQLVARSVVSAFFAVAAGSLDAFLEDPRVRGYLAAGAYVIADFADAADAVECERRTAHGRGSLQ